MENVVLQSRNPCGELLSMKVYVHEEHWSSYCRWCISFVLLWVSPIRLILCSWTIYSSHFTTVAVTLYVPMGGYRQNFSGDLMPFLALFIYYHGIASQGFHLIFLRYNALACSKVIKKVWFLIYLWSVDSFNH